MSLPSQNLDAFVTCAQTGHFTRAAKLLHITQSALSQRIRNLEEELETQLFVRERSGVRLTDAGSELLRFCLEKAELEREVLDRIKPKDREGYSGDLRIGGFSSVMRSVILPSLAPLVAAHQRLKLTVLSKEMDELPSLLKRGEIDYMVLYNEVIHDDIEIVHLGDEVNVLVEAVGYRGGNVFLDHDANDQTTARYLKTFSAKKPYSRRYLDEVYGLIDGVKLGLGRAVVPIHLIKGDAAIKVVNRKQHLIFPVNLHFYRKSYPSRLHHDVLSHLKEGVRRRL